MSQQFALDYLMSRTWALDQSILQVMADIARRRDEIDLTALTGETFTPLALEGRKGQQVGQSLEVREDGIAVLHVNGVISRYASLFSAICGGTSTQMLARDLTTALDRTDVRAVVLNIDSRGGDANGINEFAEMVFAARGRKPLIAYVGGDGCSAAYWIASAADEVVIDATARVGSIGTVMAIEKRRKPDDVEVLEIVSSQSPKKRLDPFSEEGRAEYQSHLDQLSDVFIDCIARNMAISRETVLSDFGGGGVLIGQRAVDAGMAHRLGSLEGVINELKQGKQKTMSTETKPGAFTLPDAVTMSADDLVQSITAARPDVIEAMQSESTNPVMALDDAAAIAQACVDAGIPALSATLLTDGITKAEAQARIHAASGLKDVLATAGLQNSFDVLMGHLDDPVKLVGQAIHEAQALSDENSDSHRQIIDSPETKTAAINSRDVYAKRRA